jgi:hypothetical protein
MKEIRLTQGEVALVDDEDFEHLNQWRWFVQKRNHTSYAYRTTKSPKTSASMHRQLMDFPTGSQIDHIDGNGLNNLRCNLRICTSAHNSMNRKKRKNTSSKYKGVAWEKGKNRWYVSIKVGRKSYYLGKVGSEKEGALVYDKIAREWFGQYARLNFPLEVANG